MTSGLHNLKARKSTQQSKRVGRGTGSGFGTTAGRGQKGQKARSGGKIHARFEGGRTPLFRLVPKLRGFSSRFGTPTIVNLSDLEAHFKNGDTVSRASLAKAGVISSTSNPVKILGGGELKKKLTVTIDVISSSAKKKIEAVGGSVATPKPQAKKEQVKKD